MEEYEDWGDWRKKKHMKEDAQLMLSFLAVMALGCGVLWMAFSLIGLRCEQTAMMLGRL